MDHPDDPGHGPPLPGQVLDSPPILVENTVGDPLEPHAANEAPSSSEPTRSTSGSILLAPLTLQHGADSPTSHLGTSLEPPWASNAEDTGSPSSHLGTALDLPSAADAENETIATPAETGLMPTSLNPTSANRSDVAATVDTNHKEADSPSRQDDGGSSHASLNVPNFEDGQSHVLASNPDHGFYAGTHPITQARCSKKPGPVSCQETVTVDSLTAEVLSLRDELEVANNRLIDQSVVISRFQDLQNLTQTELEEARVSIDSLEGVVRVLRSQLRELLPLASLKQTQVGAGLLRTMTFGEEARPASTKAVDTVPLPSPKTSHLAVTRMSPRHTTRRGRPAPFPIPSAMDIKQTFDTLFYELRHWATRFVPAGVAHWSDERLQYVPEDVKKVLSEVAGPAVWTVLLKNQNHGWALTVRIIMDVLVTEVFSSKIFTGYRTDWDNIIAESQKAKRDDIVINANKNVVAQKLAITMHQFFRDPEAGIFMASKLAYMSDLFSKLVTPLLGTKFKVEEALNGLDEIILLALRICMAMHSIPVEWRFVFSSFATRGDSHLYAVWVPEDPDLSTPSWVPIHVKLNVTPKIVRTIHGSPPTVETFRKCDVITMD